MIAPQSIAQMLGLGASIRTVGELEAAVSAALPKRALERLSARLHDDRRIASAYKFKMVPQATWKRRSKRLSVDESEKTERLARVLATAEYVWDDRQQACEWMSKPHRELDSQSPLESSAHGTRRTTSGRSPGQTLLRLARVDDPLSNRRLPASDL